MGGECDNAHDGDGGEGDNGGSMEGAVGDNSDCEGSVYGVGGGGGSNCGGEADG